MLGDWQNVEYEVGLVYRPYVWAFEGDNDAHVLHWRDSHISGLKPHDSLYARRLSMMTYESHCNFQLAQLQNTILDRNMSFGGQMWAGFLQAGASMLYRR